MTEENKRNKPGPKPRDKQRQLGESTSLDRASDSNSRSIEDRIPMSATMALGNVTQEENFYYRWLQNKDGRLEQARQAGYEPVMKDGQAIVRNKGAFPMHLMRLPMKYRQQDLDRKAQEVNNTLIEKNKLASDEYIPGQKDGTRSHVLERDRSADFDPLN